MKKVLRDSVFVHKERANPKDVAASSGRRSSPFKRSMTWTTCVAASVYLSFVGHGVAADPTIEVPETNAPIASPFSFGYGVKLTSDYIFRGQTQSDGKPAVQGYVEGRFFDWFYAGIAMSSVSFPSQPWGLSDPAVELDYFAGVRHTWDRFSLDVGALYFTYPGQIAVGGLGGGLPATDMNMVEFAAKPSFAINKDVTVGGTIAYSPDYVGTGAPETYLAGNIKVMLPPIVEVEDVSWFASGEFGRQWLGTTALNSASIPDSNLPDFNVWNVGLGVTYKNATLDLRYWGSTLDNGSSGKCFAVTSMSNACGDRVALTLSFDM